MGEVLEVIGGIVLLALIIVIIAIFLGISAGVAVKFFNFILAL